MEHLGPAAAVLESVEHGLLGDIGSWPEVKDLGKLRREGKDYGVLGGGVVEIKFNV